MALIILAVVMLGLILLGEPIGFALSIGTLAAQASKGDSLLLVPQRLFNGADNFPLVAIPLFILAGQIMNSAGISRRLVDFGSALVGFLRGGLAHVAIVTSMIFAEMSGSAVADAAALGSVLIPAMVQKGYPRNFAVSVVSSAATVAIIIPPSIPMILYAVIAEVSVTRLFLAGFIPGIIFGLTMMVITYVLATRYHYPIEQRFQLRELGRTFLAALPSFSVPVVILGGIFAGIFTATESAGMGVVAALIIGFAVHRELRVQELPKLLMDAALQTAVVMLIVAASAHMGSFLSNEQVPQRLAQGVLGVANGPVAVFMFLNVIFLIAGMFLHSAAAIVTLVPIVLPLVKGAGIDLIHFGLVLTINLGIGQQTPPVASVLLTTCSIGKISIAEAMKVCYLFILMMIAVLLLVTYVPEISLFLPNLLAGS
jgi:tripartite ATP-independent transporter DctM subunit